VKWATSISVFGFGTFYFSKYYAKVLTIPGNLEWCGGYVNGAEENVSNHINYLLEFKLSAPVPELAWV